MKKNCFNCKHVEEWSDSENEGHDLVGGYLCHRLYDKHELRGTDIQHEINMTRKSYLEKGKRCFESK